MLVREASLRVQPREFKANGRKDRRTGEVVLLVARGAEFPQAEFDFLVEQLTKPRVTVLSVDGKHPHEEPFVDQWAARGYDTSTLRFSISHLGGERQRYPRPRTPRVRTGVIQARWGCVDDTVGDICTTYSGRWGRRDSNCFHAFLSSFQVSEPRDTWGRTKSWQLLDALKRRGYNVPSLRFEVHHADRPQMLALRREVSKQPTPLAA